MKKLGLFVIPIIVLLNACDSESPSAEQNDLITEEVLESVMDESDMITDAATNSSSGRIENEIIRCATVSRNVESKIITIDFGEGCEGPNGRIRKGQILIQLPQQFGIGATRTVTFNNFYVDDVKVEGVRTITNITDNESAVPSFTSVLTNGKLIFPDGSELTREATHTRTWHRAANPRDDYASVTGSASGVNRGKSYSSVIEEELIFKRSCGAISFIPVSGMKIFTYDGRESQVNYGNGECDNIVNITRDGETFEKTINIREHLRKRRRG